MEVVVWQHHAQSYRFWWKWMALVVRMRLNVSASARRSDCPHHRYGSPKMGSAVRLQPSHVPKQQPSHARYDCQRSLSAARKRTCSPSKTSAPSEIVDSPATSAAADMVAWNLQ